MVAAEFLKVGYLIDVFTSERRCWASLRDLLKKVGVPPGDDVLHPLEVIFFVGSAETDNRLHADVAEMIGRERSVIPDGFTDGCNVFAVNSDALVGQLVSGERVWQALVVLDGVLVGGFHDGPWLALKHIGADIYLDPCETAFLARLGDGRKLLWRVGFGCIRVDSDFVAPLTAEQLVDGDVVDLANDIP